MSNAVLMAFDENGALMRVRNRLGTDLTSAQPVSAGELAAIRATLEATATQVTLGVINVVTDHSAVGNGIADDTGALTAAIAAANAGSVKVVLFPAGTYKTNALTVPSGVTLWFLRGAVLSVNTGQTVTINGQVDAGSHTIFGGLGTVSIDSTRPVRPHWWNIASQAVVNFAGELAVGTNSQSVIWTPATGALSWTRAPILRATLLAPANVESNMAYFWAEGNHLTGQLTVKVHMLVPVTLTSSLSFLVEVIG
jgi:hypothetical protein